MQYKRYTDANKWLDGWFMKLPMEMKLVWQFLCDRCDAAGVIAPDMESIHMFISPDLTDQAILEAMGRHVVVLPSGDWWLPTFIPFHFSNGISGSSPLMVGVRNLIQKHALPYDIARNRPALGLQPSANYKPRKEPFPTAKGKPAPKPKPVEAPAPAAALTAVPAGDTGGHFPEPTEPESIVQINSMHARLKYRRNCSPQPPGEAGEVMCLFGFVERFSLTEKLKRIINRIYGRPHDQAWSYADETALVQIAQRPNCFAELKMIRAYRAKMDDVKFFPGTPGRLFERWQDLLDMASQSTEKPETEVFNANWSARYRIGSLVWTRRDGGPIPANFEKGWDDPAGVYASARDAYDQWIKRTTPILEEEYH